MNRPINVMPNKQQKYLILTILCLMPILGMAVDLLTPSLPSIVHCLNVSPADVKNIISIYLFGYAFGNFFTGLLTDVIGRKILMRISLIGCIVASLLPVFFPKIEIILLSRLLQGLMFGSMAVIARAVFSDILHSDKLVKLSILMGSMFGIGPLIGPFLGGYLQSYFGWQSCFTFFTIILSILCILIFKILPETHLNRNILNINTIKCNINEVIMHRTFMGMVVIMGVVYSLSISFNIVGPFIIQTKLRYTPIFYWYISLLMGGSFISATFICQKLLHKFKVEKLLLMYLHIFLIVAILAICSCYFFKNNIYLLCIISALMFAAQGFIFSMASGYGLSFFRHIAGIATATMYFLNIIITCLVSFILSCMGIQSIFSLFCIYAVLIFLGVIGYWLLVNPRPLV